MKSKYTSARELSLCSVLVALAAALAFLSELLPLTLPFGGSVTLGSMLPIVLASYLFGIRRGLGTAFVFSLIQLMLGLKTVSAFFMPGESEMLWWKALLVCFLDYIAAYTVVGLAGLFRRRIRDARVGLCIGAVTALGLRYLCHILSGAIFFGMWAEWFFSEAGTFGSWVLAHFRGPSLAVFYSVCYNGLYMIPEILLTTVLAFFVPVFLKKPLGRYIEW